MKRDLLAVLFTAGLATSARAFLTTPCLSRGIRSGAVRMISNSPHRTPATVGAPVEKVETPALLLDMDLFESNCKRMSNLLSQTPGVAMRPHVKAHKSPDLAALQMQISNENGVKCPGVCAQTMREAEVVKPPTPWPPFPGPCPHPLAQTLGSGGPGLQDSTDSWSVYYTPPRRVLQAPQGCAGVPCS